MAVDETIERFRKDRQLIQERMSERNQHFKKATENYLKSIQKELETIKSTQKVSDQRNQDFRDQINDLFVRYESGGERLRNAFSKTNQERINYNNYLIKIYPHQHQDEKKRLIEENEQLQQQIQGYKDTFQRVEKKHAMPQGDQDDFDQYQNVQKRYDKETESQNNFQPQYNQNDDTSLLDQYIKPQLQKN
ncbi:hypothetical protein pb186bvf_014092 [Paramecium bursaria]